MIKSIFTNYRSTLKTAFLTILFFSGIIFYFGDYREVKYDSEPDYIANGLIVNNYGKPLGSHHPGTINYYFVATNLLITKALNFDLKSSIYFIRIIYFFLLIVICYFIKLDPLIYSLYFLITASTFLNYINFIISAEILLATLSFLLYYFLSTKKNFLYSAIIFGLMLNIKLSCIVLSPLILYYNSKRDNAQGKWFLISALVYLSLHLTGINQIKNLFEPLHNILEQINLIYLVETLLQKDIQIQMYYYYIFVFTLLLIFVFAFKKINRYHHFFSSKFYLSSCVLLYTFLFIISQILFISHESQIIRHLSPVAPLILCSFFSQISSSKKVFLRSFFISMYAILFLVKCTQFKFHVPNSLDNYILNSEEKVFLFHTSKFNSDTEFIKHLKYRYSNSSDLVPNEWTNLSSKTEYLNTHFTYLDEDFSPNENKDFKYEYKPKSKNVYQKIFLDQLKEIYLNKRIVLIGNMEYQKRLLESTFNKLKKELKHDYILYKSMETDKLIAYGLEKL